MAHHHSVRFSDYGVDDYAQRATHQPSDSDPYVEVPPVSDSLEGDVVLFLESADMQMQLHAVAGPIDLHSEDLGVGQYQRVLALVRQELISRFPTLFDA